MLLLACSVALALVIAEGVLRVVYPAKSHYYVWQPNLKHTFYPDTSILSGLQSPSTFSINANGVRGDVFKADKHNYLCMGGSTTECLYLDDTATWPHCLQQQLNSIYGNQYTFGNIGKSGVTTRDHYIQLKYSVSQLKNVEGVILMVGLNDLMKRLSQDTLFDSSFAFTPQVEDSLQKAILLKQGRAEGTNWWRRTALFYLLQQWLHSAKPEGVAWQMQDDKGEAEQRWRQYRQQAISIIDTLPDLTAALNEYERNLQLIYNQAVKQKLKIIFVNQAAIYKDTMPGHENSIIWMGGIGKFQTGKKCAYYSAAALRRGVNMYNNRLALFCAKNQIRLIDISAILPRNTSAFYDDCHLNQNGAKLLGNYMALQKWDD